MALPLGQSTITPFKRADFSVSMQQGKYCCGYNMFQLSISLTPCPGVPTNRRGALHSEFDT